MDDHTNAGRDAGDDMRKFEQKPEDDAAHRMAQEANDHSLRHAAHVTARPEAEEMPEFSEIYPTTQS